MEIVEAIIQLKRIFTTKTWGPHDIEDFVFINFCTLFENLKDNNERSLVIELIQRYLWIPFAEYQGKIVSVFESVEEAKLKTLKKIYLFPVMRPEDEAKIKSGHYLIYQIKSLKRFLTKYKDIKFEIITRFEAVEEGVFELKDNEALFLVDDFLGSGETINACFAEINKNKKLTTDKVFVISIASQREIFEEIQKNGIAIYSDHISSKGISDYNSTPELEEKIDLMKKIEKMIPGGSHYSLGYNSSEALITLTRTPDNTFPIFWKSYRTKGKIFEAPFSREEIIE